LFLFAPATPEAPRKQLKYEPEKVTLTGRVVYRTFYGPPNYGETPKLDSRETQPILLLDAPVDVIGTAGTANDEFNQTERGVKAITLVSDRSLRSLTRQRVVVQGTLFHAHTGHHHTKVLMATSSVKRK
jgi:hypothetical protein